jgi:hypothetical protein
MPRGNLRRSFDRGFVRPHSRANRLKMEANPYRPFKLGSRFRIRRELLRSNPWWWVTHRRGIFRPKVGQDPLEARAVPKELVKGTLPERIVYRYCVEKLGMIQGVDMDFQSCVRSDHRVLTADLRWVRAGDLKVGDKLVSFDEEGKRRCFKVGTVIANRCDYADVSRVEFSDGSVVWATPEHPWLTYTDPRQSKRPIRGTTLTWVHTDDLRPGLEVAKPFQTWDTIETWDSGYLAGFFDGEGSLVQTPQRAHHCGWSNTLTAAQNKGETLNRFMQAVEKSGFRYSVHDYDGKYKRSYDDLARKSVGIQILGGVPEIARFLGSIRPPRLLGKLDINKFGGVGRGKRVTVVSVEHRIGRSEIARLGVDTHTYIAEGFCMHNSLEGGRLEMGGIVVDFTFRFLHIAIQVQGPTHNALARFRKDEEQRLILEQMGYSVIYLDMALIYDQPLFEDTMRAIFLRQGYARGGVHGNHEIDEGVNGQADELERLSDHVLFLETLFSKVLTGMANEWQV